MRSLKLTTGLGGYRMSIQSYLSNRMVAPIAMSSTAFTTVTTTTKTATATTSPPSESMEWESIPSMNMARDAMGVATLASVGLIAIGGGDNHGNYFTSIEVYGSDVTTPATTKHGRPTNPNNRSTWYWKYGPDMNHARSSLGVGVINNDNDITPQSLYAVGGRNHNGILDVLEILDHQRGTWSTGPSMKEARRNMGVASLDRKLFVMGGEDKTFTTLKSVEIYDPQNESWTSGVSMDTARQAFGACFLDGKLYVVGGIDSQGNHLSTMEIFDPTTNEWSSGPSMSSPHIYVSVSAFQGRIYVVDTGSSAKPTTTKTTEEVGDQLLRYSSYINGPSASSVEIFDPSTQEWSLGPVLNGNLLSLGSSVLENELYAVGGCDIDEGAPVKSVSVLSTDQQ